MGVQSEDNRGRTYGLIGKTPAIKVTGKRFRCSMISSITNEGDMRWMVYTDKFDADKFGMFHFMVFLGNSLHTGYIGIRS